MAKKKKFKLLVGTHAEGKKIYRAGDTVESEVDLAEVFGKDKFVPEQQFQADAEAAAADAERAARGENVTDQFEEAVEAEVEVFKKKGKWFIYESDGTPITGKLKKCEVVDAIELLHLALDERDAARDEEDDEEDEDDFE